MISQEDRGEGARFPEREAEILRVWEKRSITAGSTNPRCGATVAHVVEKHCGFKLSPKTP